ncbi:N-carbamoylputrescine amidase [Pseudanabaena sp. UWO310]|uniref:N-carbamoylputrescine amidase n=1 Tax=Pseudanabaena sp. UWO310 TaxID=2480795 RepID=UPI00115AD091|nr:N-carbamoylputrescine amidase [Pseudanabaena sp. UWO310]TYQ29292.1 N-carbamoylputrescine amidase [Pseudanabaena sp. UWO310]
MSSPRTVTIAVIQTTLNADVTTNVTKISELVSKAAHQGAQIILPPELFEGPYFCREEQDRFFAWAQPVENHPTIAHFQHLAKELNVVIPISFFERSGQVYYNSLAMIDADGSLLGVYRKSHIPDGPGYEEKFYFREGDTGFKVWDTAFGKIGVGICWDQWFPECARAMVLMGAEILLYPTAIGSEPEEPDLNTKDPWQRAMIGHAVSNVIPVAAANRIGLEGNQTFYGHSFIANHRGDKVAELSDRDEGVILASFDLNQVRLNRASFGFFRDRRPDLYQVLLSP